MAAPKLDLKSVLTKNCLPGMSGSAGGDPTVRGVGKPLTFYWTKDTHELFFADAAGNLINFSSAISAVLNGTTPIAIPWEQGLAGKDGNDGRDGSTGPRGEKGERGEPSTVPGPQGIPGQSIKGDRGERGTAGPDSAVLLADVRQALAEIRSQLVPLNAEYHRYLEAQAAAAEFRFKAFSRNPRMERVPKS